MLTEAPFINRDYDVNELSLHVKGLPNSILFVYGPKSSGKSTLIMKVRDQLQQEDYKVKWYWFDLRRYLFGSFKDVLNLFLKEFMKTETVEVIETGQGGFSANIFFLQAEGKGEMQVKKRVISDNIFVLMERDIIEHAKKGFKPVVYFDEIQTLRSIYMNGGKERLFIDELFNFFVALTKVNHLAHVLVATSDTFLIEEIWNNSKLQAVGKFWNVGWLDEEEVRKAYKRYGLSEEEIDYAIDKLGGYTWGTVEVVKAKTEGRDVKRTVDLIVRDTRAKVRSYLIVDPEEELEIPVEKIKRIFSYFKDKDRIKETELNNEPGWKKTVKRLVLDEVLFYDPVKGTISPHSKTTLLVIRELLKS